MLLLLVFASSLVTRLFMINELVCIVKVINNCKRWIDEITYFIFEKKNHMLSDSSRCEKELIMKQQFLLHVIKESRTSKFFFFPFLGVDNGFLVTPEILGRPHEIFI